MKSKLLLAAVVPGMVLPNFVRGELSSVKKPNVVIILADDMGYGDISCYNRNQVQTPNMINWQKKG